MSLETTVSTLIGELAIPRYIVSSQPHQDLVKELQKDLQDAYATLRLKITENVNIKRNLLQLNTTISTLTEQMRQLASMTEKGYVECCVCFEAECTHASVPCGHYSICEGCSQKYTKCVICNHEPVTWLRIYHAK